MLSCSPTAKVAGALNSRTIYDLSSLVAALRHPA